MSLKKILIILIALLILVLSILVIYNFFIKEPAISEEDSASEDSSSLEDASIKKAKVKAISQEPVLSPIIDGQRVKYYLKINGNVFESNFDGSNKTRISSNVLQNLLKILWSPGKDKVLAVFEDNGLLKKYFYDYTTGISAFLDDNIRYVCWAPEEDKIAYQYYNSQTGDNNIGIANPDGSKWSNVFQTRMDDLIIEWPSPDRVAFRTKASGLAQSVVYTIDVSSDDLRKVVKNYGLSVLWSPEGDKLLFSETDSQGKKLKLKIADLSNQLVQELDFVTLPEKCVWSQDNRTLFCAVPKGIPASAILPDDFYKQSVFFNDEFWRINLDTGETVKIRIPGITAYNVRELILPSSEDYLLFVEQKDGLLYSLEL
jgi:hypothetical protein